MGGIKSDPEEADMKKAVQWLLILSGIILIYPMIKPLVQQGSSESDLGALEVLEGGRIKPFDSVARQTLLLFRGKQSIRSEGGKLSAEDWLTDVIFNRDAVREQPVFRIDHPQIVGMLGNEPGTKKYFSYADLEPYLAQIQQQARQIDPDAKTRTAYERSIGQLFGNLIQYQMLTQTVYPLRLQNQVRAYYVEAVESARSANGDPVVNPSALLQRQIQQLEDMASSPLHLIYSEGGWQQPGSLLRAGKLPPVMESVAAAADARQAGDAQAFEAAIVKLNANNPVPQDAHPGLEHYFNQSQPFIVALIVYVAVILLVFLGWQFSSQVFLPPAYAILWMGFLVHTIGLILRVIITGYAPVTNLYSSAVFTGWVAVLISLALEPFQRRGVGTIAAAVVGFLTLLVAHHLSDSGDTMEKMRAVLNSNFWLSTHVITIVMGYGAAFLAGFLGITYLLFGWLARGLTEEMRVSFKRMVFGAICFALLFSFVGTVLGGIWADQSWGRFWGWDPKENGALLIVLWCALVLHALRCRMIGIRGLMNLAIGGNIVTAWSWFGTNMLGVGLHSYGFMDSAFFWLVLFWVSQLMFIIFERLFPVRAKEAA
jgi:ABC-type transport system involved in cytochrome c biogenesis permease subunit